MPSVEVEVFEGTGRKRVNYSLEGDINGAQTLEELLMFNQQATLQIGRTVLKEEQNKGFDKQPRQRTDNVFDKQDINVKPLGKIEYFARRDVGLALVEFYREVDKRSPEVTGQYRSGNVLFFNGVEVADTLSGVQAWVEARSKKGFRETDEIRLVNVNPYARKMEFLGVRKGTRGRTKGVNENIGRKFGNRKRNKRTVKFSKPNGAYALAFRSIRNKYKSLASVLSFTFMPNGTNGIQIQDAGPGFRNQFTPRPGAKLSKRDQGRYGRPYLYPSIRFKLDGSGVTGEVGLE